MQYLFAFTNIGHPSVFLNKNAFLFTFLFKNHEKYLVFSYVPKFYGLQK